MESSRPGVQSRGDAPVDLVGARERSHRRRINGPVQVARIESHSEWGYYAVRDSLTRAINTGYSVVAKSSAKTDTVHSSWLSALHSRTTIGAAASAEQATKGLSPGDSFA